MGTLLRNARELLGLRPSREKGGSREHDKRNPPLSRNPGRDRTAVPLTGLDQV
jgi:hypothetical protein